MEITASSLKLRANSPEGQKAISYQPAQHYRLIEFMFRVPRSMIIDDHQRIVNDSTPRENHMMFLWQLVNLEFWLRSIDEKA